MTDDSVSISKFELLKMAVLGSCPQCKVGYLVNILDDFTAQYAEPVFGCKNCGYKAIEENIRFSQLLHKEKFRP